MKRGLILAALLLLPFAVWADGKVFPATALPTQVTIPDQEAFIHWANGIERLVIETRFNGEGTNFAWVVPLPAEPKIEAATTGFFPTLRLFTAPHIEHGVPKYYLGILLLLGLVVSGVIASRRPGGLASLALGILLVVILLSLLLPSLSSAGAGGGTVAGVQIVQRSLIGSYESTVVKASEVSALRDWFRENEFHLPSEVEPVLVDYIRKGWVFVATKLRRDAAARADSVHPLSFRFPAAKPVYPMRLTGLGNGPLAVSLYVVGDERARLGDFRTEMCGTMELLQDYGRIEFGSGRKGFMYHPLLEQWVASGSVLTKLTATLEPRQMTRDFEIEWEPFVPERQEFYSYWGALTVGLNWGVGLFAGLWLVVIAASSARRIELTSRQTLKIPLIAGACVAGIVFIALPKMDARFATAPSIRGHIAISKLALGLRLELASMPDDQLTLAGIRSRADSYLQRHPITNLWTGGWVREEDSPGNYTLTETNGVIKLHSFSYQRREVDTWSRGQMEK